MPTSGETPPIRPLSHTPARAATPALQGYDYQVWISLDKWLSLSEEGILFLEGAEYRLSGEGEANTIQVRRTSESISFNNKKKARTAIKQFWVTRERELSGVGREVRYTYLTTSDAALENNASFGGRTGIATWEHARHEATSAEALRSYLHSTLDASGSLVEFLRSAPVEELQRTLFSNFFGSSTSRTSTLSRTRY